MTTLGTKGVGSLVNIEVDCVGKWIRKILGDYLGKKDQPEGPGTPSGVVLPSEVLGLTFEDLRRHGLGG